MSHVDKVEHYLRRQESKTMLRFITCGSVDDGKSTLIGRLLYDSQRLLDDQLITLIRDSERHGTHDNAIDYALLLDGLDAEREQGITIDVAYRFFDTTYRKYIVADCPGHTQYTRNMATGASTADLAVVLVDATKGLLPQTRRHTYIVALMGIQTVVLAINKMDLVNYSEEIFCNIADEYQEFAHKAGVKKVQIIPVSALIGDNLFFSSPHTPYYNGPTLMHHLEHTELNDMAQTTLPFRLPVQYIIRSNPNFRGFSGTVISGSVKIGEEITAFPSNKTSKVTSIIRGGESVKSATTGEAVAITLSDEIDISRGDVIVAAHTALPMTGNSFTADLLWLDDSIGHPNKQYWLKIGTKTTVASITQIHHLIDINTLGEIPAKNLHMNEVASCHFVASESIVFDPYQISRKMGGFILIDRQTNNTVAAGMIRKNENNNLYWHKLTIDKSARSEIKNQKPKVLWFTGISGAGKSTVANIIEKKLHARGKHSYILDGDNIRHGLNKDLDFSDKDRVENIRRVAEVAKLMTDAGLIVLVSFISPFSADRQVARELFTHDEFFEIYLETPLEVAERRDMKGLYKKARAGEISNFTAINSPYEPPSNPEFSFRTDLLSAEEIADEILSAIE